MSVTFLRTPADYFGIQEAPAQPLFQQTRALADPAVQNQLNFQDQITALRQQRPLARTQAIQNEYNAIFENANRLRQQQEAAKQAEQAVSALAGLTPEADDYVEQRRQIQRQFPSAMLDSRVQSIVDDNDRVFNSRQSAAARQQQELQQRRAKLFGAGATPQQVELAYQNPDAAAQLEYQLGKGGSSEGRGNTAAIKSAIELLNDDIKAMADAGENYTTVDGKDVPNPAYQALLDRRNKYRDAYLSEVDRALFPQVKTATGAGAAAVTTETPAPTSFRDAMRKSQPEVKEVLKVDQAEILKDLDDPAADENTFMMAIQDPNTSFEVKKKAAERMRQIAEKPKKVLGLGIEESTARKGRLMQMAEKAEKQVRMYPEVDKFRKAWTDEKSKVDKWINEYADSMGYDIDELKVSLANNSPINSGFSQQEQRETYRDRFEKFIEAKHGDVLSKKAESLKPFQKSEFAKELGVGTIPTSLFGTIALGLISPNLLGGSPTYANVLDAYLEETKNPAIPETSVAPKPAAKNIKSITPISNPAPQ